LRFCSDGIILRKGSTTFRQVLAARLVDRVATVALTLLLATPPRHAHQMVVQGRILEAQSLGSLALDSGEHIFSSLFAVLIHC
jgi:hypothetical protein